MSFTSQNYSVGKQKRMDRVLLDCMLLSAGVSAVIGVGAYVFGSQILRIYNTEPEVIQCGLEILSITTVPYFLCGIMDLIPGRSAGNGSFCSTYGSVCDRYGRNADCVDLRIFPAAQISAFSVYLLSGFLDYYNCNAGGMLLVCEEKVYQAAGNRAGIEGKIRRTFHLITFRYQRLLRDLFAAAFPSLPIFPWRHPVSFSEYPVKRPHACKPCFHSQSGYSFF